MKITQIGLSFLLILTLAGASLIVLQPTIAQSKPSTPTFTVQYVDNSYDVPPTYGKDQFTGKTVVKQDSYHVDQRSVLFKVRNQPFTAYNDSDGNTINLYFNFRYKGHYGSWSYYPFAENGDGTCRYGSTFYRFTDEEPKIPQSNLDYTEKAFTLGFLFHGDQPSVGSLVDLQVQAIVGHIDYAGDGYYRFVGVASDWTSTQTLTIGDNSPTTEAPAPISEAPTQAPTATPTETPIATATPTTNPAQGIEEGIKYTFDWQTVLIGVLASIVVVFSIVIAAQHRRLERVV